MVCDASDTVVDEANNELKDWKSSDFFHVQGQEELTTKTSEPGG